MQEHRRAQELERLLSGTLRFGCERMEDYHDRRDAGLSLRDLAQPNIDARKEVDMEAMETRVREGRATVQDLKWKRRIEEWRKRREEEERRSKQREEQDRKRKERQEWERRVEEMRWEARQEIKREMRQERLQLEAEFRRVQEHLDRS